MPLKIETPNFPIGELPTFDSTVSETSTYDALKTKTSRHHCGKFGMWFANFFWDFIHVITFKNRSKELTAKIDKWKKKIQDYETRLKGLKNGEISPSESYLIDQKAKFYIEKILNPYQEYLNGINASIETFKPIESNQRLKKKKGTKKKNKNENYNKLIKKYLLFRVWKKDIKTNLKQLNTCIKAIEDNWSIVSLNVLKLYSEDFARNHLDKIIFLENKKDRYDKLSEENEALFNAEIKKISTILTKNYLKLNLAELTVIDAYLNEEINQYVSTAEKALHTVKPKANYATNNQLLLELREYYKNEMRQIIQRKKEDFLKGIQHFQEPFLKSFRHYVNELDHYPSQLKLDNLEESYNETLDALTRRVESLSDAIKNYGNIKVSYEETFPKIDEEIEQHKAKIEILKKSTDIPPIILNHFNELIGNLENLKNSLVNILDFDDWIGKIQIRKGEIDQAIEKCTNLDSILQFQITLSENQEKVKNLFMNAETALKNDSNRHLDEIKALRAELDRLKNYKPSYFEVESWEALIKTSISEIIKQSKMIYKKDAVPTQEIKEMAKLIDELNNQIETNIDLLQFGPEATHPQELMDAMAKIKKTITDKGHEISWYKKFESVERKLNSFLKDLGEAKKIKVSQAQHSIDDLNALEQIKKELNYEVTDLESNVNSFYEALLIYFKKNYSEIVDAVYNDYPYEDDSLISVNDVRPSHLKRYFYHLIFESANEYSKTFKNYLTITLVREIKLASDNKFLENYPPKIRPYLNEIYDARMDEAKLKEKVKKLKKEYKLENYISEMKEGNLLPSAFEFTLLHEMFKILLVIYSKNGPEDYGKTDGIKLTDKALRVFAYSSKEFALLTAKK